MADNLEKQTFSMATASKSLSSDSTSLVDLKAEVFRKKEEALYNKANSRTQAKANDPLKRNKNNLMMMKKIRKNKKT